jgi:hypothetical protein
MRKSNWTPSIVPNGDDQNVYIVVDDFGGLGRAYREIDVERVDLEEVIMDMARRPISEPGAAMVAALFGFRGLPVIIGNAIRCSKILFSVTAPTATNFASSLGLSSSSETSVPMSIITIGTPVTREPAEATSPTLQSQAKKPNRCAVPATGAHPL